MSANIEYLYDKDGNIILPKTVTKAITDENGNRLDKVLGQPNMDMVMLGWSVPIDCPIKNYVDDNRIFHQIVGRVDLGSLSWAYHSDESAFNCNFIEAKNKGITYCYKYVNVPNYAMFRITDNCVLIEYIWSPGINIKTNEYTDPIAFKNAMKGVFLYYELDKEITFPVDGHEQYNRTNDLKMLGWTVPTVCPIQYYTVNVGIYHQRVARVDLGSLSWNYVSAYSVYVADPPSDTPSVIAGGSKNTYSANYKTYTGAINSIPDKSIQLNTSGWSTAKRVIVKDSSLGTTGKPSGYFYYELGTEILIPIDGNEATTNQMVSDEWTSAKAYTQGDFAIYKNKLWKSKVANNLGNIPAEGTYWTATNVGKELTNIETISFTLNNGFTKANTIYNSIYKHGKTVTIVLDITVSVSDGNALAFTLPEEYRPFIAVRKCMTGYSTTYTDQNYLQINTDGKVIIYSRLASESKPIRYMETITYIAK